MIQYNKPTKVDDESNNKGLAQNGSNHQIVGYSINDFNIIPTDLSSKSENQS